MFPKTSLMIIGYRRVFLVIALGLDQAVCASDRAEILMPRSLQANCNQVWSSSIHGDRWWNKRVWTSWWIKRIWEPRIWSSCWFYCCSTGLTVIFSNICGVCVCRVIFLIHFHMTLLAGQGAQRSLMQRAQTFSDPFWALPSPSKIMSVLRLIDSSWRVLSFWYPSQIRFFECFVLMSCFDAACHLAQHVLVQCTAFCLTHVSLSGWGSQIRYKVARCERKRTLKTSFVRHAILSLAQVPLWFVTMSGRMLELFVSPCAIQLACATFQLEV